MNEVFNLERQTAMKELIDPTGRKWVVHGQRGSALVHARPDPDRADAQIPKEFKGQWTSPTVLREKIEVWLNSQWNKSDETARLNALRAGRTEMPEPESEVKESKQTPEESLATLDPKIVKELGAELLAVEKPEVDLATLKMEALRDIATPLGIKGTKKSDLIAAIEMHQRQANK